MIFPREVSRPLLSEWRTRKSEETFFREALAAEAGDGRGPGARVSSFSPDADRPSYFSKTPKTSLEPVTRPPPQAQAQAPPAAAPVPPSRHCDPNGSDDGSAALAAAGFAALAPPSSAAPFAAAPAAAPSCAGAFGARSPLWAAPPRGKRSSQQQAPKKPNQNPHAPAAWARAAERVLGNGGGGASSAPVATDPAAAPVPENTDNANDGTVPATVAFPSLS